MKHLFVAASIVVILYILVRFAPIGLFFLPFIPMTIWAARKCKAETGSYRAFAEGMAYTVVTMLAVCLIAVVYHLAGVTA